MKIISTFLFSICLVFSSITELVESEDLKEYSQLRSKWLNEQVSYLDLDVIESRLSQDKEDRKINNLLRSRFSRNGGSFQSQSIHQSRKANFSELYILFKEAPEKILNYPNLFQWVFSHSRPEAYILFDKLQNDKIDELDTIIDIEAKMKVWRIMDYGELRNAEWENIRALIDSLKISKIKDAYLYSTLNLLNKKTELDKEFSIFPEISITHTLVDIDSIKSLDVHDNNKVNIKSSDRILRDERMESQHPKSVSKQKFGWMIYIIFAFILLICLLLKRLF